MGGFTTLPQEVVLVNGKVWTVPHGGVAGRATGTIAVHHGVGSGISVMMPSDCIILSSSSTLGRSGKGTLRGAVKL
ncbi:hypothetical protein AAFF_G00241880 [Aldrovandia affinis]|uniref:Uncharacterized protein n=1 Tax=Aldrovandia affinis TaxID=143900 RepID=A0AAD7WTZ6_9TELE|nr:hypothetical protein AAFF_G00241880 [Aldrovandia affinis]